MQVTQGEVMEMMQGEVVQVMQGEVMQGEVIQVMQVRQGEVMQGEVMQMMQVMQGEVMQVIQGEVMQVMQGGEMQGGAVKACLPGVGSLWHLPASGVHRSLGEWVAGSKAQICQVGARVCSLIISLVDCDSVSKIISS